MDLDQHDRCLSIARAKLEGGDPTAAKRFVNKALGMKETSEGLSLLQKIEKEIANPTREAPTTASTTSSEPSASSSTTHARHPPKPNLSTRPSSASSSQSRKPEEQKREYTAEQMAIVKRIKSCKEGQFYEIMSLEKTCTDGEIKKSYRKLALALHPDKNGAPGADEAFKLVSKSFQILSDPDKRAMYDRDGADPDSRASMSSSRGFSNGSTGMHRGFNGGGQFAQEVNPEDLFNAFFGGGSGFGGGSPFGGQTFTFGNGGFHQTRVYPQRRARNPQGNGAETESSLLSQLAPMLILVLFSLISFLPNILNPPVQPPSFSFAPRSPDFTTERLTSKFSVPYYVNPAEFNRHPIFESIPGSQKSNPKAGIYSSELRKFEEQEVELGYVKQLNSRCNADHERKQREIERHSGFFGVGADWEKVKNTQQQKLESCEELKRFGHHFRS
ncbi:Molecular chaperone (DnaJ superfamily) [Phaffia rhodozyma]|uniref:Molecular chaperone (DnaJ superfamily) n=1 Tax=Phaffia rhodozyma TaxID=264483 RepID=A0A0F7SJW8_PHARH|nr:Molecular chaperone (DnaJ superfamily) [Phaffia rhodozyma]